MTREEIGDIVALVIPTGASMNIDPVWRFVIGLVVTTAIAISQGTLVLTHAIPTGWIPGVTAWCGILAFVGSAATTTISGLGMGSQARIAAAASLPEVKTIVTEAATASAAPSDKVVAGTPK
jgi:hypothetical protein